MPFLLVHDLLHLYTGAAASSYQRMHSAASAIFSSGPAAVRDTRPRGPTPAPRTDLRSAGDPYRVKGLLEGRTSANSVRGIPLFRPQLHGLGAARTTWRSRRQGAPAGPRP